MRNAAHQAAFQSMLDGENPPGIFLRSNHIHKPR